LYGRSFSDKRACQTEKKKKDLKGLDNKGPDSFLEPENIFHFHLKNFCQLQGKAHGGHVLSFFNGIVVCRLTPAFSANSD